MKFNEQRRRKPVETRWASESAVESLSDRISGCLIYAMVIFSPWAFGTTQAWSIWTMNISCYVLGGLLLVKWLVRGRGLRDEDPEPDPKLARETSRFGFCLGALAVSILFYCLISAANARATYFYAEDRFEYHQYIAWLPHSYDSLRSWSLFWNYLALACSFWAVRDWLQNDLPLSSEGENPLVSRRWKCLLWVMSVNGGLIALEGVLQRADHTGKLLWLVEPRIHKTAEGQFGPYAYRSNGAQLLNLIWPVALGLWWSLQRSVERSSRRRTAHHLLLPAAMLMAAASIISLSRGGVIISVGGICASLVTLFLANRKRGWKTKCGIIGLCVVTLGLAVYVNWSELAQRFGTVATDQLSGRVRLFQIAGRMIRDYPVFGTGPNTFDPVSQLYRESTEETWTVQVHNDWLETLATFGWVGSSLIWLALLLVLTRPFFSFGGIRSRWVLVAFFWMALGGCLVHAGFDFPFQVYSILFLFLVLCATLSLITMRQ